MDGAVTRLRFTEDQYIGRCTFIADDRPVSRQQPCHGDEKLRPLAHWRLWSGCRGLNGLLRRDGLAFDCKKMQRLSGKERLDLPAMQVA